jgi:hypothetical protein
VDNPAFPLYREDLLEPAGMAMSVAAADRILEELPPLKRGLAVQLRVVEAILRAHSAEVPPDEVDARMARIAKAFHGRERVSCLRRQAAAARDRARWQSMGARLWRLHPAATAARHGHGLAAACEPVQRLPATGELLDHRYEARSPTAPLLPPAGLGDRPTCDLPRVQVVRAPDRAPGLRQRHDSPGVWRPHGARDGPTVMPAGERVWAAQAAAAWRPGRAS